jgi:hypothetical protein
MTVIAFVGRHYHQYVKSPKGLGGQCVDLANLFLIEERHQQEVMANAVDWSRVTIPGMIWTPNAPINSPGVGSLVVWGQSVAAGTGPYGHIALALLADSMTLITFDQNWPVGYPCLIVRHPYDGVLGWHRPGG